MDSDPLVINLRTHISPEDLANKLEEASNSTKILTGQPYVKTLGLHVDISGFPTHTDQTLTKVWHHINQPNFRAWFCYDQSEIIHEQGYNLIRLMNLFLRNSCFPPYKDSCLCREGSKDSAKMNQYFGNSATTSSQVDSHGQAWRSCYDMEWSWWFILAMVWSC